MSDKRRRSGIFVLVAVASLVTTGFSGCGSQDEAPVLRRERQTPADSAIAEIIHRETPLPSRGPRPDEIPAEAADLFRYLENQNRSAGTATGMDVLGTHRNRAEAASRLLKLKLNPQQRFAAVQARLDALLRLAAAGDPEARREFREFAAQLSDDSQPAVAEAACAARLVANVNEQLAADTPQWEEILAGTRALASRFPNSFDIAVELNNVAEMVLQAGHRGTWKEMLGIASTTWADHADPRLAQLAASQRARIELTDLEIDGIVGRVADGDPGAIEAYRAAVQKVFASPNAIEAALPRLLTVVDWLEAGGHFEQVQQASTILAAEASGSSSPRIRESVSASHLARQRRLQWAGRTLDRALPLAGGGTLDTARFSGRHLVVVFWSPSEPGSVDLVREIAQSRVDGSSWELLGICLSKNANVPRTLFGGLPDWPIVLDANPVRDLKAEFGVTTVPHIMLVDRDGRIAATHVPPENLKDQIRQWSTESSIADQSAPTNAKH